MTDIIKKICFAVIAALSFAACSDDSSGFSTTQLPIINGQIAADENYGAVVSLSIHADKHYYTYCTGTLIREDAVLTAAHCVSDSSDFSFSSFNYYQQIQVLTGINADNPSPSDIYDIADIHLHPDYTPEKPEYDIAIVFLDTPVLESKAKPLPIFQDKTRLPILAHNTQRIEFAGYGITEDGSDGKRKKAEGFINNYCAHKSDNSCGITTPLGERYIIPPGSMFHDIEKGGACLGDSGGPVLIEENGALSVIGVVAYGDAACASYAITTAVPDFAPWIEETLNPPEDDCSASDLYVFRHNKPRRPLLFMICCVFFGLCCMRRRHDTLHETLD